MSKKIIVLLIIGAVVVGAGSFYGGIKYARKNPISRNSNFTMAGQGGQFRNAGMGARSGQRAGGLVMGQIISKDDKSITIKLADGGSKIIFFTDKTDVTKNVKGSATDLTINDNVVINGSTNADGSISAQTIQLGSNLFGSRQMQSLPMGE